MPAQTASEFPRRQSSAPIIGRERELRALEAGLTAAIGGRGGLVLIGGEAGIGKTTLVEWAAAAARDRGMLVRVGQCYDMTLTPPYGPWLSVCSGSGDGDAPLAFDALSDTRQVENASQLFEDARAELKWASNDRPLLVALEDMHWADASSIELLRVVARDSPSSRLLLIVTYRSDELSRHPALARALPLIARETPAVRLHIQPLSDDETRALVRGRYALEPADEQRLVAHVQSSCGGNPFFLTELLQTLERERVIRRVEDGWRLGDLATATAPPMVRQMIANRLDGLDDDARRLLNAAAVVGQVAPLDVLHAVFDRPEAVIAAVDAVARVGIIAAAPDGLSVRFSHALARDAVYQDLPLASRHELHRQVAGVLAARPEPPLSDVASHLASAADPDAVEWLARAGERALALFAPHDAIDALTRAHDLAGRFARDLPLTAYRSRAVAYAIAGEFHRARHDHELVLDRARSSGDRSAEWQALLDLGLLWSERDHERAGVYCRAALDLARSIDAPLLIAHSLNRLGNWHVNDEDPSTAARLHGEALRLFEDAGDAGGLAQTLDLLGMTSYLNGDLGASAKHYERALPIMRELDDRQQVASCLIALSICGGELDYAVAMPVFREQSFWLACAEEALALTREIRWQSGEALATYVMANVTGARGNFGKAMRCAVAAGAIARRIEHREWEVAAHHTTGLLWRELLDPDRARKEQEHALAVARSSGSRVWVYTSAAALAGLYVESGDVEQAAAVLQTLPPVGPGSRAMGQRLCLLAQAQVEVARSNPGRALDMLSEIARGDDGTTPPRVSLLHTMTQGNALAQLGRHVECERAYAAVRDGAALFGFRPLLWRAQAALAELYGATGRAGQMEVMSRSALGTIESIAATIEDEAVRRSFLERAGNTPGVWRRDDRAALPARLSARELDVLRLLVEGSTDREIAVALGISPRTVHRHVTGIFNKMGVNTRTAAASSAIRHRIV